MQSGPMRGHLQTGKVGALPESTAALVNHTGWARLDRPEWNQEGPSSS